MELHCQTQDGHSKTSQLTLDSEQEQLNIFHKVHVKLRFEDYIISELFILCYILRGKSFHASGMICQVFNVWNSEVFYRIKILVLGEL